MFKTKPIANIVLAITTGLFLLCYPFRAQWWMSLGMHVFGAAMIGGLADWYAVTALFTKPLGISYKTALLPQARNRIIMMARTMVTEELLTDRHIYQVVKNSHVLESIITYALSPNGKNKLHSIIADVGNYSNSHFDKRAILEEVKNILDKGLNEWQVTPLLLSLSRNLLALPAREIIWKRLNKWTQAFLLSEAMEPYFIKLVTAILEEYKSGAPLRELTLSAVNTFFEPKQVVETIREHSIAYLTSQESLESPLAIRFFGKMEHYLEELKQNENWQQRIETEKVIFLEKWLQQDSTIINQWQDELDMQKLIDKGETWFYSYLQELLINEEKQVPIDRAFRLQLIPLLQKVRPLADSLVVNELETYSAERMTNLVKEKVYYDLQMVRINGSLVGAMLGGIFFLVYSLIKGVS